MARATNLLAALSVRIADDIAAAGDRAGAGGAAAAALATLHERPAITVGGLSLILGLTHSGTVRLVDRLVAAGLARRVRGMGRDVAVHLTPAGSRAARRVRDGRRTVTERALAALPEAERERFLTSVELMLGALTAGRTWARRTCRLCDHAACAACPVDAAATARGE